MSGTRPEAGAASAPPGAVRAQTASDEDPTAPNVVELGWVVVGRLDRPDHAAVRAARTLLLEHMRERFPAFTWRMPFLERADMPVPLRTEPVELLHLGLDERDARHWDYVLVITGSDLVAHSKPFTLAVSSRALAVGVLSTARIDPEAQGAELADRERVHILTRRVTALTLHLLAHLAGLEHGAAPRQPIEDIEHLDAIHGFDPDAEASLEEELRDVADLRVEEARPRASALPFYLRSAWINRGAVASSVIRARPWLFPVRLSRLTTAAMSALLVLVNTAEVWEVATKLSAADIAAMSLFTLAGTSWYVVRRQRLLARRGRSKRTEQAVVTNISMPVIVALGMLTTYLGVFVLTAAVAALLYPDIVVSSWAAVPASTVAAHHFLRLGGFVAAIGIVIGALGASFEQQHYFQHMVYVDEEV